MEGGERCAFPGRLAMGGGAVAYHSLPDQPNKLEQPPEAEVEKYGSAAAAKSFARRRVFSRFGEGLTRAELRSLGIWPPRSLKATLDRETHQWTITGVFRVDRNGSSTLWEKEIKAVIRYVPSSRTFAEVSRDSGLQIGPETGWRPANELGKWLLGNFPEPGRRAVPASSFRLVSNRALDQRPSQRPLDQRLSYSHAGNEITAQNTYVERVDNGRIVKFPRGVKVGVEDAAGLPVKRWTLHFEGPRDDFPEVGAYGGAETTRSRTDTRRRETPGPFIGISLESAHGGSLSLSSGFGFVPLSGFAFGEAGGEFVVWEIEVKDEKVVRLAIDFIWDDGYGLPRQVTDPRTTVCGSVRFNSLLEPTVPVPGPDAPE
jgi:hypothetical protein